MDRGAPEPRSTCRWAVRAGGLAAVTIALAALFAVAAAHAVPERLSPAPGATLDAAPARVEAWFSQDVRRNANSWIRVEDERGQVVSGATAVDDADRRHLWVDIASDPGPGPYLVVYEVHSDADGDISGGCYLYFVGQQAALAAERQGIIPDAPPACPVPRAGTAPATGRPGTTEGSSHVAALFLGGALGLALVAFAARETVIGLLRRGR